MNQQSDRLYDILYGDKDTFLIAWLALGQRFHLIPHHPKYLQFTMCQRDPTGGVLFQHRNEAKWILRGHNPRVDGFRLEQECFDILHELGTRWDGRIFHPPSRSNAAREAEQKIAQQRRFVLTRVSSDRRWLELLPSHGIGEGAGEGFFHWHVADADEELMLVLGGDGRESCRLRQTEADRVWRGRMQDGARMPVELMSGSAAPEATGSMLENKNGKQCRHWLDAVMVAYSALPCDVETRRDFIGTIRTLALLDPTIVEGLCADTQCLGWNIHYTKILLDELSNMRVPRQCRPAPRFGWRDQQVLESGYERLA